MLFRIASVIAVVFTLSSLLAQEPPMAPGRGGGRNLREFLGLGPAPDPVAAKLGEPIYKQNCGGCHGETGRGSQGPNLVRSTLVLHDEKGETIGPVIKAGRPQAGMPAFPALSKADSDNIAQYLHMQVELAANRGTYGQTYSNLRGKTSGDAAKGQAYFQANCSTCHSAGGDLNKVAGKFPQAAGMQARFLWPATQGPRKVTVVEQGGGVVSGTLSKMDDFIISLRATDGSFREWPLDKVKVQVEDKLIGHRALLPKYSDSDIHNVTAYLLTLK